ncbi:hypothetical protein PFISCL1PPCAC_8884, partial [Pristionchus fissidentatus]
VRSLISNRDLSEVEIIFKWSRAMESDIDRVRKLIYELPVVKNLELTWIYWGESAESLETELMTDDLLLHLTQKCTAKLRVGEGNYSVEGMKKVHQRLESSGLQYLRTVAPRNVADNFFEQIQSMPIADWRTTVTNAISHGPTEMIEIVMEKD